MSTDIKNPLTDKIVKFIDEIHEKNLKVPSKVKNSTKAESMAKNNKKKSVIDMSMFDSDSDDTIMAKNNKKKSVIDMSMFDSDSDDGKREKTKKTEVKLRQEVRDDTIMIDKDKAKYIIESLKEELITTPMRLQRRGDYAYFWRRYNEFKNQIDNDLTSWTRRMERGHDSVYEFVNKLDTFIRIASYVDDDDGNAYVLEKDIDKLDKLLNIDLINKAIADKRTEKLFDEYKKIRPGEDERNKGRTWVNKYFVPHFYEPKHKGYTADEKQEERRLQTHNILNKVNDIAISMNKKAKEQKVIGNRAYKGRADDIKKLVKLFDEYKKIGSRDGSWFYGELAPYTYIGNVYEARSLYKYFE